MQLNELYINTFNDNELNKPEYVIIIGKNTVYFVDGDDAKSRDQLEEIVDKEGYKIDDYDELDIYYFQREINENYPQVITFYWKTNSDTLEYYVPTINHIPDFRVSKHLIDALKLLKKKIDYIKWLDVYEFTFEYDTEVEHEDRFLIDDLINNYEKIKNTKLPELVYHGTCTKYLPKILKTGLVSFLKAGIPKPNFEDIEHSRLSLTSNILDAYFYASNAANTTKSFPVILEINSKGIDVNKISFDYDLYNDYIGVGDEEFDEIKARSERISRERKHTLKHLKDKYIGATFRKFSYDGRIMPKWIINIYYKSSYEDTHFNNVIKTSNKDEVDEFLEMVEWIKDVYGYDNDEYFLNIDDYNYYKKELEEEMQEKMKIPKLTDFMKENVSPNKLEVYFDNIQDFLKKKLIQPPFNVPEDSVDKYLTDTIISSRINQLKIKDFVATQYDKNTSPEEVADMILDQQKEGIGRNDLFKKKNVNDKNSVYTDEPVPNPLMGEMIKFEKFMKK